ncbi:uncharacterized protein LOC143432690 [Xylocopa sonorina]|uniref:uncharacterized protein LOC143432690 n=1 Tax=Xylocopa sonorina TaxID=1818115 RepID=UPI00403ACFD2
MFKKFKDKLAEEMKQSPARLQASMQQLAQAVVSPAISNSSVQELSASNDNFSLTEEGDETPKNSPAKHGFQNVDLISPTSNSIGMSRRSSISSITSDTSSLFPIYECPPNLYHLQSDMDQSASEIDENISPQLDKISKDQMYSAYRKMQARYHKYRGRYMDLAKHYRKLEGVKGKLESVLVETQDKVLRRIADLKEQCQLEQQAKAHLEEALRNDIEEKDHIINTLNTKIKLLQTSGPNLEVTLSDSANDNKGNLKDNLIDLSSEASISSNENPLLNENTQLKDKLKKLENVVLKYKESLKRNRDKFTEVLAEKNILESNYKTLENSYAEKEKELSSACAAIKNLTEHMSVLEQREEESVLSLAANKLSVHRELEDKEEQIKKLQLDLKHMTELKENLSEVVNKYKIELEKLKLSHNVQQSDSEKNEIVQDVSKGKSEALKPIQQEIQQKLTNLEGNIGLKYHEEDSNKENTEKSTKTIYFDNEVYQSLKSKLDEKEVELQEMNNKLEEFRKLAEEYQAEKDKVCMELSNSKSSYVELQNELDAQKIIAEEKMKIAEASIEELQATVQTLNKELENTLIDKSNICEDYDAKILEYVATLEKTKDKLMIQETEIKMLKEKLQDNTEVIKLNNDLKNRSSELLEVSNELQSYKSIITDLQKERQIDSSNISSLREEKNNLIKSILHYKILAQKLKQDNAYIRNNMAKQFTEFSSEIFILKDEFNTLLKANSILQNNEVENLQNKLKEFEEFKQKYDQLGVEFRLDLRNLPEQVKSLMIESKSLKEELNNATTKNQLLSDEINDLKTQLEETNSNANKLIELEQKYVKATETITLLQSQNLDCNKLKDDINMLQTELKNLNENLTEKHTEVNALTNLNKTLHRTVDNKVSQLTKLKTAKQRQYATIHKLKNEIDEVKASNAKLLEQLEILENEMTTLKSENCQIITLKKNNITITSELEQLKSIQNEINLENKNLKDKQNQFLKHNEELNETNENLKQKIVNYEKYNQQLLSDNTQLSNELQSYRNRISEQNQDIDYLKSQITLLNTELQSSNTKLKSQLEELVSYKKEAEETEEHLTKENKDLRNEIDKLNLVVEKNKDLEEKNKTLMNNLELLDKEIVRLKIVEEEANKLKLEINNLNGANIKLEEIQSQNNELITDHLSLKNKITELENVNTKLQSYVNNLESKVSSLQQIELKNTEVINELDTLKDVNTKLMYQIENENIGKERLTTEIDELKHIVDEKVAELKLLDTRNMELLNEIERLKSSTREEETILEADVVANIDHLKETIAKLQEEIKILENSNIALQEEIKNVNSNKEDASYIKKGDRLEEQNKILEAQLDEALITFQAKELQMQLVNNELKNQTDKLKEELKTNEEEQSMRLKQLVKEFQAQLQDKEEELHAALEKRFDRQQNYESSLIQQYKEQLKDFQVELTAKSEQIENLILENKNLMSQKSKDINQLVEKTSLIKKEHMDEIREVEKKWKSIVQQKTDKLAARHEEEINELTREWRNERRPDVQSDLVHKELESTSRVAMAAVQSNTGSFHTLQQTLTAQRRELAELRKLVKLRHDTLEDSTEIEYLRNILFEYMMGRETMVLARVIAAVVKFDQEQTTKILKKEEDKMTLLGSLGLT